MLLEGDINIAVNGPFWVEVAIPEHPFTAMVISRSNRTHLIKLVSLPYLEEEAEADPLVVLVISPLLRVQRLVHAGVGDVKANPLPEGTWDGVGGVDPAVRVEHFLWDVF